MAFAPAGCVPESARDRAAAADAAAHTGIYTWLFEHDPSALTIAGLDAKTVRAVAPDARVRSGSADARGCARALSDHALLAAFAATGTAARQTLDDCGYALYRDGTALVVAPR